MSFTDIIQTAQSVALAGRLNPDEMAIWHRVCRDYSKLFHTPLITVQSMDPEHVLTEVYSEQLSNWDLEERLEDFKDMIGSLSDPEYDIKKERALREETKKIIEEERERVAEGRPIHESLIKEDLKFTDKDPFENLPKSGGLSSNLLDQLKNNRNER